MRLDGYKMGLGYWKAPWRHFSLDGRERVVVHCIR